MKRCVLLVASVLAAGGEAWSQEGYDSPFAYDDPKPQAYVLSERASIIDPRVGSHPEIKFPLEKDGRPRDVESAYVDTRVKPRGKLVLALTGGGQLFKLTKELGMHAIRVPYADGWFNLIRSGTPAQTWRGDVRLEAATGEDFSPLVDIPKPDGLAERSRQFVKWLARQHPQGRWDSFLTRDGDDLRWEDVILVGLSHGSTSASAARAIRISHGSRAHRRRRPIATSCSPAPIAAGAGSIIVDRGNYSACTNWGRSSTSKRRSRRTRTLAGYSLRSGNKATSGSTTPSPRMTPRSRARMGDTSMSRSGDTC
jgi:hypothetical protein